MGLHVGDSTTLFAGTSTLVPIRITGTFSLFPTAPSSDGPVIVVNRDRLETWNATSAFANDPDLVPTDVFVFTQAWCRCSGGVESAQRAGAGAKLASKARLKRRWTGTVATRSLLLAGAVCCAFRSWPC